MNKKCFTSSVRRQSGHFAHHVIEYSFRRFHYHDSRIQPLRMLQVSTKFSTFEKILNTFDHNGVRIKVYNCIIFEKILNTFDQKQLRNT